MRSSFADIVFVAHSVMGRQLFGFSPVEIYLDAGELEAILDKNLKKFPNSWVFLIQRAKFNVVLTKNLENALSNFEMALGITNSTVAIQCIVLYEMGLIHLLNLDYDKAIECFSRFIKYSKWSNSFNTLLMVLLNGSVNDLKMANQLLKSAPKSPQKRNPIENYAHRRLDYLKKWQIKSKHRCQFFLLELLFLWVYIPFAPSSKLIQMLQSESYKAQLGQYHTRLTVVFS
jgi:hypothetical protein